MPPSPPAEPDRATAETLGRAAKALFDSDQLALAREVAAAALTADPGFGNAHSVMAGILDELGDPAAALPHWQAAARLMPRSPQSRFNLALALLARGDYPGAWELYEARLEKPDWVAAATRASLGARREQRLRPGNPVTGLDIVVLAEQGLGDCIMFARYLPLLTARGARVTLVCKPSLQPVFARVAGIHALLSPPADQPEAKLNLSALRFDAWVPLLSLPGYFATTPETVPGGIPYLRPDPQRVAAWRARYAAQGGRAPMLGVVFHANPDSRSCVERSMQVADLAPLAALDGIALVNLQYGPPGRALMAAHPRTIDAMDADIPLDEFAAAVAATDLLLTVDTMAAHCAGAMGHPTWLATSATPHWYWSQPEGATSPWYPGIRIIAQTIRRDWSAPVIEVAARLRAARPDSQQASKFR